jgi:hypothetical protein
MAQRGRPSSYSEEIAGEICTRLAQGQPLSKICSDAHMPEIHTVYNWHRAHTDFLSAYARARDDQADTLADEIIAISDTPIPGEIIEDETGPDGRRVKVTRRDMLEHRKLRVDARKWVASKLKPGRYSDRVLQEHTGRDGGPIGVKVETRDAVIDAIMGLVAAKPDGETSPKKGKR